MQPVWGDRMTDECPDEKKMVENSAVGAAYPPTAVRAADDVALRAARAELYTETGYGDGVGRCGHGYFRGENRPQISVELAGARRAGGAPVRLIARCA